MSDRQLLSSMDVLNSSNISFGTSGARGLVTDFSQQVCAAFTHAFIDVMKQSYSFSTLAVAIDNRPSSYAMAKACVTAAIQQGLRIEYYGVLPTPALAHSSIKRGIPSIMVTGSHIPFDRNGLKFYRPDGEITKSDEQAILSADVAFEDVNCIESLDVSESAKNEYLERYWSLFNSKPLIGKRIGVYEHSSAGRDIYPEMFAQLGAEVISLERTDVFVPIDTEAVAQEDRLKAAKWSKQFNLDAIFTTDGDGDRPLVADENGEWLRGDILGLLCAKLLGIQALSIPISCNSAVARSNFFAHVEHTRIGSPYVIAAFDKLTEKFSRVAGFEANGGFLLGSDITFNGNKLSHLATRDAVLPAVVLMCQPQAISEMVKELPSRFTASDRIQNFSSARSKELLSHGEKHPDKLLEKIGFTEAIDSVDTTDGLRITLSNSDVIHLRASGNAPELRCYSEASTSESATRYVDSALEEIKKHY